MLLTASPHLGLSWLRFNSLSGFESSICLRTMWKNRLVSRKGTKATHPKRTLHVEFEPLLHFPVVVQCAHCFLLIWISYLMLIPVSLLKSSFTIHPKQFILFVKYKKNLVNVCRVLHCVSVIRFCICLDMVYGVVW